jgi:iron-sulfur cluster repair protein YtfE (RIC family)
MIRHLYQKFQATSVNNVRFWNFSHLVKHAARNRLINSLIRELAVHSVTEEVIIYPQFEKHLSRGMQLAQQARQEHQQLKNDLYELDQMKEDDPKLPILLKKVMDEFNEHARDEETHILPLLKTAVSTELAIQLGDRFQNFKVIMYVFLTIRNLLPPIPILLLQTRVD